MGGILIWLAIVVVGSAIGGTIFGSEHANASSFGFFVGHMSGAFVHYRLSKRETK